MRILQDGDNEESTEELQQYLREFERNMGTLKADISTLDRSIKGKKMDIAAINDKYNKVHRWGQCKYCA
jgi:chromosome segregation ATPase